MNGNKLSLVICIYLIYTFYLTLLSAIVLGIFVWLSDSGWSFWTAALLIGALRAFFALPNALVKHI